MPKIIQGAPLQIVEVGNGTEQSRPQVSTQSHLWDSRLQKTRPYHLSHERIQEIQLDATVSFMRQVVVAPAIHSPWTIEATEKAPTGAKELVEKTILPHRIQLIQQSLLGAMDYGWAPFEVVYKEDEGAIVISKFKQLLQEYTWVAVALNSGSFAGLLNLPQYNMWETFLPVPYGVSFALEVQGTDWYGKSISAVLDNVLKNWGDVNTSANRYDRKVAGSHWVVYFPVGETTYNGVLTANDEIARTILSTLEASGAVAIPDEIQEWIEDDVDHDTKGKWRVELLSDSASTSTSFSTRLAYLDALKVRAYGIPERSVLEGQFGTKAEAESHADVGIATIDTKHRLIVKQLNQGSVNSVLRFNYGRKAEDTVYIQVAPIVDTRLQMIREVFRLIIQNPDLSFDSVAKLDIDNMVDMLGLPSAESKQVDS